MTNYSVTSMKVGICYKDKEWAIEQIKRMASLLDENIIEEQRDTYIALKDGSYIIAVPGTDFFRGRRFDKIYIQRGVHEDFINTVLRPCIHRAPALQIEITDDETGTTYYRGI